MPHAALRPCTWPGCNTLVSGGRCDLHSSKKVERSPATKKLYNSPQWQAMRRQQLADHPWCVDCLTEGKHVPATEVDHIVPHHGDPEKFYAGPFASRCKPHHSRKTAQEVWHSDPPIEKSLERGA